MVRQGGSVRAQVLVFLAAFAYLAFGIRDVPLASGYTDPVAKVRPQDEALYSSIAIGMADRGEWLTPRFLGRLAFVKPILAFLPAALSVRALGVSRFSLRLFPILCGAALLALFWRWGGWSALLLLAANPLFFLLSRRNMTDVPVLLAVALTVYLWGSRVSSATLAAGILIKSVAGALPALFLFRSWWRVAGLAALIVLPWHLYQLATNTEWYWKEHILDEHLQWGLRTPENAAADPHALFYLTRAWSWDPLLTLALPVAVWLCWQRKFYRELAWLGVTMAALFVFGYRNATYLLPVFAIVALVLGRAGHWSAGALLLSFRLLAGAISYAPVDAVPPASALAAYCEMGRGNGLLVYSVSDEFTASTLPLPRVQYMLQGDRRTLAPTNIDFAGRGIISGEFRNRDAPQETVLLVNTEPEWLRVLALASDRDALLPETLALQSGRQRSRSYNGWTIAFAPREVPGRPPVRSCRL